MATPQETKIDVGGVPIAVVRGGFGRPLLILHDELGYAGWMTWNDTLAESRELIIPLQPAYGRTPKIDWIRDYRDLALFYGRMIREQGWGPVDVIGFSAGGFVAAELAAASPQLINKLVLVAPLGLRPLEGEIFDFLAVTIRTHVAGTVTNIEAPEFATMYGGDMTSEQFELFEDARAETARLGWEPFMFSDSLAHHLQGIGNLAVQLIWGDGDIIAPRGEIDAYRQSLPNSSLTVLPGSGHRPEIEDPAGFLSAVTTFLGI